MQTLYQLVLGLVVMLTFPSSSQCIATKLATLLTAQLSYEHAKKYIYLVVAFCLLRKCAQIEYHACILCFTRCNSAHS